MALPSPDEFPGHWSTCMLGSYVLPPDPTQGAVTVDCKPTQKVDQKKAPGKNKAASTEQGVQPAKVTISLKFTAKIWADVEAAISGIWPPTGPLDIAHPNTSLHRVASVMVLGVSGVSWDRDGVGSYSWDCEEWVKAPAAGTFPVILRWGSQDRADWKEVSRWQQFLVDHAYTTDVDGIFASSTATATRAFQTAESIQVDAIVGPETFGAAGKYGYVAPPPVKASPSVTKTPKAASQVMGADEAAAYAQWAETTGAEDNTGHRSTDPDDVAWAQAGDDAEGP